MSYKMEEARRMGELEILLEEFEPTPWPVNILYTSRRLVPLKLRAFIDWTEPRLRARLAQQSVGDHRATPRQRPDMTDRMKARRFASGNQEQF